MSVAKPSNSRAAGAPFNQDFQKALQILLARMDNPTAQDAFRYIMTGMPAGILPHIAAHLEASRSSTKARWAAMLEYAPPVMLTFGPLDKPDAAAARRLGDVLTRFLDSGSEGDRPAAATDFFRALATVTELCLIADPQLRDAQRWLLDGPRCLDLLALEGAGQAAFVEILFTPFQAVQRRLRYTHLLQMSGLREALAAAPERTLQGAQALRGSERARCIELLQSSELATLELFGRFLAATVLNDTQPAAHAASGALLAIPGARALLEGQVPPKLSAQVRERIAWVLHRVRIRELAAADTCRDGSGYRSISGEWIAIAAPAPLPPDTPPPADLEEALRAAILEVGIEAQRVSVEPGPPADAEPRPLSEKAAGDVVHAMSGVLSGQAVDYTRGLTGTSGWPLHQWSAAALYARRLETLLSRPGVTVHHLARLFVLSIVHRDAPLTELLSESAGPVPLLLQRLARAAGDLRPVLQACQPHVLDAGTLMRALLRQEKPALHAWRPLLWQVVGEQLALIDAALVRTAAGWGHQVERALELLSLLPETPARYGPILLELASQGAGAEAVLARALLAAAPDIGKLMLCLLDSPEQEARIAAACWVRERGDREAVPALRAALAQEKAYSAQVALLVSLGAFENVSQHFCGPRQLEEARVRLAASKTQLDRCLPLDLLPPLTWADGQEVPPELVRWWVVRTEQLKQPRADPLLQVTLNGLEPHGAAQLAWQALSRFALYDTQRFSKSLARSPLNCEQALEKLSHCAHGNYVVSAYEHRGILALLPWADPTDAAALVRTYLRHHSGRRQQSTALLEALAAHPAPPILALLCELAGQERSPRLRTHATALCEAIAQQRGWTTDELADHAAPTAGLNEHGVLKLPSANGVQLTAEVGADLRPLLRDSQGKAMRRLSLQGEHAPEAEQLWQQFRKQLPQIVEEQSQRLQQAMISGRHWQPEGFTDLLRHPILGRLCQLLVFDGVDVYGTHVTFRPAENGHCLSAVSDRVDINGCYRIRLAHRALLEACEVNAWLQHFADYKLVPLLAQFG